MEKIVFKKSIVPFYKIIEIDGDEVHEKHELSFSQGMLIVAEVQKIDGDLWVTYQGMTALFDPDVMDIINPNPNAPPPCCGDAED